MSCSNGSCSRPIRSVLADELLRRIALYPVVTLSNATSVDSAESDTFPIKVIVEESSQSSVINVTNKTTLAQLVGLIDIEPSSRILIETIPLASQNPTKDTLEHIGITSTNVPTITLVKMDGKMPPPPEVIKTMLRLEVLLRTCPYVLGRMGHNVDSGTDDWMPLIEPLVQRPIVRAFGYETPEQERVALMYLRSAATVWPQDSDFRTIPFWVRVNRARDTYFKVGDEAPEVMVHPLNQDGTWGQEQPLINHQDDRPDILIAGSIT
jgi:hypothetical protein